MHYLGIDIGSSFTKFVVIDSEKKVVFNELVKTLTRTKDEAQKVRENILKEFEISKTAVTGYGRLHQKNADIVKTELYCASVAVSELHPIDKTIIDIGGEDLKVIKSASSGKVIDFYMNTKCAAGTGTFITEIAERAEIKTNEMSSLAKTSAYNKELNSFCTVFAKTEIMQWIFEEVPVEDIAKGIYISVVNRLKKIPMDKTLPFFLIGGVAEFHPYIKNVMEEIFSVKVTIPEKPQFVNAFGAALFALDSNTK